MASTADLIRSIESTLGVTISSDPNLSLIILSTSLALILGFAFILWRRSSDGGANSKVILPPKPLKTDVEDDDELELVASGGKVNQPGLLIPAALVMIYNRWNDCDKSCVPLLYSASSPSNRCNFANSKLIIKVIELMADSSISLDDIDEVKEAWATKCLENIYGTQPTFNVVDKIDTSEAIEDTCYAIDVIDEFPGDDSFGESGCDNHGEEIIDSFANSVDCIPRLYQPIIYSWEAKIDVIEVALNGGESSHLERHEFTYSEDILGEIEATLASKEYDYDASKEVKKSHSHSYVEIEPSKYVYHSLKDLSLFPTAIHDNKLICEVSF
ncbi:hypothetical protein KSS87_009000 [Heliosperma pusillum]|nr:hypothetical protein KSS87_009000 [Heliosperma pusillum]